MGRRSDHTKEELRELVINATRDLIREQGVGQVTVRQIAQAVGYTPGMMYSLFENLNAIFLHVNVRSLDSLYADCVQAQKKADGPEKSIQAMGLAYLKFAQTNTHQFQLMFQQLNTVESERPSELGMRIQSLFELVENELRQINADIDEAELKLAARTLWSGVHGAAALNLSDRLFTEEKNADRLIVAMLVKRFVESWRAS